jgi:hypothetical protein
MIGFSYLVSKGTKKRTLKTEQYAKSMKSKQQRGHEVRKDFVDKKSKQCGTLNKG